jgi:DNA transformation protein and related proteins
MAGRPVSTIRNLGPASVAGFARAGIHDAETLREIGADAAYLRLLRAGSRPHFIAYYTLVLGLQGRPWNDAAEAEKNELRRRFDALKAAAKRPEHGDADAPSGAMERDLDALGVIRPRA